MAVTRSSFRIGIVGSRILLDVNFLIFYPEQSGGEGKEELKLLLLKNN